MRGPAALVPSNWSADLKNSLRKRRKAAIASRARELLERFNAENQDVEFVSIHVGSRREMMGFPRDTNRETEK